MKANPTKADVLAAIDKAIFSREVAAVALWLAYSQPLKLGVLYPLTLEHPMTPKLKILSVRIERATDTDADLSHLGKFTDDYNDCAIIRLGKHKGTFACGVPDDDLPPRGQCYRYFLPTMTGEETGNPESPEQDWKRAEAFNAGEWHMLGIVAKAVVWNPATEVTQTIRSGGLWGIESDSDAGYLASVEADELSSLRAELLALGLKPRAIAYAFKTVKR